MTDAPWVAPDTPLPPHPLLNKHPNQHINHFGYLPMQVTVFIPTHRRPNSLNITLASLIPQMEWIAHIIVCPNPTEAFGYSVNAVTYQLLETLSYRGATWSVTPCNTYASACRLAAQIAKTEVVLWLDDDMPLGAGYLDMSAHFRYPEIGAVSGTLQCPTDVEYADWSREPIEPDWRKNRCNRFVVEDGKMQFFDKWQVYLIGGGRFYWYADYLLGGALMLRSELLAKIDDNLFRYSENGTLIFTGNEIDLSITIRGMGYHLIYDAKRVAWHLRATEGRDRSWSIADRLYNWNYLLKKHGFDELTEYPGVMKNA